MIANGQMVKRKNRTWVGVYDHPHVLWITGTHRGKKTIEYNDLLELYHGFSSFELLTFNIKVTMKPRWIPHFLSMLKYMEQLGSLGSSRKVTLYADGDGDFRPTFEFDESLLPYRVEPVKNENGNKTYDAG